LRPNGNLAGSDACLAGDRYSFGEIKPELGECLGVVRRRFLFASE
jgi:hypothetical protein